MYDEGDGMEQDKPKALYRYKKDAEQGNPNGQYNLALCIVMALSKTNH